MSGATREHKRAYRARQKAKGLTRAGTVPLESHPWEHSGWYRAGPSGNYWLELCAACGRPLMGRQHHKTRIVDRHFESYRRGVLLGKPPRLEPDEYATVVAERKAHQSYQSHARAVAARHPRAKLDEEVIRAHRRERTKRWRRQQTAAKRHEYNRRAKETAKIHSLVVPDAPPELIAVAVAVRALRVAVYERRRGLA